MNNPADESLEARLLKLMSEALENGASRIQLNDWLRRDAEARRVLARLLVDEQALAARLRDESMISILEADPTGAGLPVDPVAWKCPAPNWKRRSVLAAIAAAVTIFAIVHWRGATPDESGPQTPPVEVAIVKQTADAKWGRGADYALNDRLTAGPLILESGLARIRFLSGATVILQGPAELRIESEWSAQVLRGRVTANVPPVAEGFTLAAAGWRAVDRGTVFGIDAASPESAELFVISGQVDLHRRADAPLDRSLTTGQGVNLSLAGLTDADAPSPGYFPTEDLVLTQAAAAGERQRDAWNSHRNRVQNDSGLLLYFDFENVDRQRGSLPNLAPDAPAASNGVLVGGEWAEGRWPGKGAVAFRRAGDLIHSRLNASPSAATFFASIRFDPEAPLTQTIMLSPRVVPGQIYWLLAGQQTVSPNVGFTFIKDTGQKKHLRIPSGRGLSPRQREKWVQVAVVYDPDHGRVRHFLNGQLIKESPLSAAETGPLDLERLVIGNWGFSSEPRNLVGRMDEFALFNRALDSAEVAALSRN